MENTEIKNAKILIAENEKKELELVTKEVNDFLEGMKAKGFELVICGEFFGSQLKTAIQIIKTK